MTQAEGRASLKRLSQPSSLERTHDHVLISQTQRSQTQVKLYHNDETVPVGLGRGRERGSWLPVASGGLGGICFAINKNHKGKIVLSVRTERRACVSRRGGVRTRGLSIQPQSLVRPLQICPNL